ncbi:MAG: 50S ribosomal protein L6 [Candidatus Saganbacteria bacterium]|nr:50S ribosomal protein L6 [Candidatus Saganbacteria bacterium]
MGRIGKRTLDIPKGVEIKVIDGVVEVKGPKGTLKQAYDHAIKVEVKDGKVTTNYSGKDPQRLAMQGLYNSLLLNMINGVTKGFEKKLEMVGVGYRVAKQGKNLNLSIGFSHPVLIEAPAGIEFQVEGQNKITVQGVDRQLVGEVAAKIRRVREVEPYKGKGIKYAGEHVRKKAGKAAKAAGGAA